ncbi:MAG: TIGR02171 family protein [Fibrobacter sp.]|nr:TIGR02171 family protein [Fibrobacter sp.]
MRKKHIAILALSLGVFPFLCSCDSSSGSSYDPTIFDEDEAQEGLVKVNSLGRSVTLGTKMSSANVKERPEMKVKFDYDFSIGKHEVTCGEFNEVMGAATDSAEDGDEGREASLQLDCSNDSLPATRVTYYDVVLFMNAKSKAEDMDTAYTYSSATFNANGNCTNLEGLNFHPEAHAYRLPTEAEWVLAANNSWYPDLGWNANNSDYKIHKVCTAKDIRKNSLLCDMAGNAMEWVNDWLGHFRNTTVTNYVGAPDGGSVGERVVKGGSYLNTAQSIYLYSRMDVYTVTSVTKADYVGFRYALGEIPDAVWMTSDSVAAASRMIILANGSSVKSKTNSQQAKLAFRNHITKNLAYIDYSNSNPTVREIQDTLDVYHPEISPDGKWVAFCTKYEGIEGSSQLYVRKLNTTGDNLVKLDVKSAAIPRWRIADGDTVIVFVNSANTNDEDATFFGNSTWQVSFSNGKFGTPKKLFDGAYHGGISYDERLAVSGARKLRSRIADTDASITKSATDTIWYNNEQACNASLSRDASKQTLFLDFSGPTGREFVGSKYATHKYIFVTDSNGTLNKAISAPEKYTFDHSEWTVGDFGETQNFAVASLTNSDGAHKKIVLVNTRDSSIVELVESEELWHPCLWVNTSSISTENTALDADSAGIYYTSTGGEAAIILRYKMELLWKHRAETDVAILGSSRPSNGVNPMELEPDYNALNLSNVPNSMFVSNFLLKNYLINHMPKLKYVLVSLDIDMWWKVENNDEDNFFYSEYLNYPGYAYDESHDYWKDGYPEGLAELTEASAGLEFCQNDIMYTRGFHIETCNQWESVPTVERDSSWFNNNPAAFYANLKQLELMVETAQKYGITIIGAIFPQSPGFKKTGSFGRYGIRRSIAQDRIDEIKALEKNYSNFVLMDENKMGDHDYEDSDAQNKDHLCRVGASKFTARLKSMLKELDTK